MTRADEYRRQYKAWSTADRKRFWITIHTIPLEEWQEIRAALQSLMTPASEKWALLWKPEDEPSLFDWNLDD